MLTEHFIAGLQDSNMREKVLLSTDIRKSKDSVSVLNYIIQLEEVLHQFQQKSKSRPVKMVTEPTRVQNLTVSGDIAQQIRQLENRLSNLEPMVRRPVENRGTERSEQWRTGFQGYCWNCQRKGHRAYNCRWRQPANHLNYHGEQRGRFCRDNRNWKALPRQTNNKIPRPSGVQAVSVSADKLAVNRVSCKEIYVSVNISGKTLLALIDTGAACNLMTASLLDKLNCSVTNKLCKSDKVLMAVNHDQIDVKGVITVSMSGSSFKRKWDQEFQIVGLEGDMCILGMDFLSRTGACIDFSKNCVIVGGETWRFTEKPKVPVRPIRVDGNHQFPPRSETVIYARLEVVEGRVLDSYDGIVESSNNFFERTGLMVARVLCSVDQNRIPVRVLNPTE